MGRFPGDAGQQIMQFRAQEVEAEVALIGELDFVVPAQVGQTLQVGLLGGALRVVGLEAGVPGRAGSGFGNGNEQVLAVVDGEIGFPLSVRQRRGAGLNKLREGLEAFVQIGMARPESVEGGGLGARAGHVSHRWITASQDWM